MEEDEVHLFGMTDLLIDDEERQDNSSNLDEEFIKPTNIIFETEEEPHQTILFPQGEIEVESPEIRDIKTKNKDLEEEYLFEQEKINLDDEVEETDNVPDDNDFLLRPTELVYEDPLEQFNMKRENSQSVNPLIPLNSNIIEEEKIISVFNEEENKVMETKDEDKKEEVDKKAVMDDDGKNEEVNKVEIKEEIKLENNEMKMDDDKKIGENEEVIKEAEKNNEINEVVKNEDDKNIEKNEEVKNIEKNEEVLIGVETNIEKKEEVKNEEDANIEKNEEIKKEEDKNIDTKEEVEKEVDTKIETNEETKKVEDTNIEKNEETKNNVDKLDEEVKKGEDINIEKNEEIKKDEDNTNKINDENKIE